MKYLLDYLRRRLGDIGSSLVTRDSILAAISAATDEQWLWVLRLNVKSPSFHCVTATGQRKPSVDTVHCQAVELASRFLTVYVYPMLSRSFGLPWVVARSTTWKQRQCHLNSKVCLIRLLNSALQIVHSVPIIIRVLLLLLSFRILESALHAKWLNEDHKAFYTLCRFKIQSRKNELFWLVVLLLMKPALNLWFFLTWWRTIEAALPVN